MRRTRASIEVDPSPPHERRPVQVRTTPSAIAAANRLWKKAGLALPPVPKGLAAQLRELSPWVFGTRDDLGDLYDFKGIRRYLAQNDAENFVLFGHAGHGINSYAMHYYLVYGPLTLLLQIPWGGVYMDARESEREVQRSFAVAKNLIHAVEGKSGAPTADWTGTLVVAASGFWGSRVTWEGDTFESVPDVVANSARLLVRRYVLGHVAGSDVAGESGKPADSGPLSSSTTPTD